MNQNNFDIIRLLLSLCVVLFHIGELCNIKIMKFFPGKLAVESFFVISGYLVWQSFDRSKNILEYAKKRIKRLIPATYFLTFLCVLVGIILTDLPIRVYLTSLALYKFIIANLAFVNFLYPRLPGVFIENPANGYVNGSLWSLKIEICFYIFIPIVCYIFKKKMIISLIALIILTRIYCIISIQNKDFLQSYFGLTVYEIFFNPNSSPICLSSFLFCGGLLYKLKNILLGLSLLKKKITLALIVLLYFFCHISNLSYLIYPLIISIFIIYLAVYCRIIIPISDKIGDLSYGIYIYHFPIIQIFISLGLIKLFGKIVSVTLIIMLTLLCSYFSWHIIEKKFNYTKIKNR